jgi:alpha-methylacyl-CoA racemase
MMLADHGAEVVRVERPGAAATRNDPLLRSRKSMTLDLKSASGAASLRALCRESDGLIEGFRPGVMERLGLGPDILLADNPRLVYGRMTGWGQFGPASQRAGHDINYIAVSGVLGAIGREGERPVAPLNLVGDFGGGGMMLAFGMVCALISVQRGGRGQVIDCAMTDGSALLMAMMWGFRADGQWEEARGVNLLDSGAPFYDTYETACGNHIAIGPIEPQFYALLRARLGIADDPDFDDRFDRGRWTVQRHKLASIFRSKTRAAWCALLEESDACFSPVLSMTEALHHPHNLARGTFIDVGGVMQPAPAPRYSETICDTPIKPRRPGEDTAAMLWKGE